MAPVPRISPKTTPVTAVTAEKATISTIRYSTNTPMIFHVMPFVSAKDRAMVPNPRRSLTITAVHSASRDANQKNATR